jgi:predicted NUDIX family phosphoesterase
METILVVPTTCLAPYLPSAGLCTEGLDTILATINDHLQFLPRPAAEEDPRYKQIIPYVVIHRNGSVFATKRLNRGGEKRLHGLYALGVGGHINAEFDTNSEMTPLLAGMMRELHEEVSLTESRGTPILRGVINDDTNAVGQVHLGLFYMLETSGDVSVVETEKLEGCWIPITQLDQMREQFETWSQIVFPALQNLSAETGA